MFHYTYITVSFGPLTVKKVTLTLTIWLWGSTLRHFLRIDLNENNWVFVFKNVTQLLDWTVTKQERWLMQSQILNRLKSKRSPVWLNGFHSGAINFVNYILLLIQKMKSDIFAVFCIFLSLNRTLLKDKDVKWPPKPFRIKGPVSPAVFSHRPVSHKPKSL